MPVGPLVKEVLINASASKVWKAISDIEEMKKWYFDIKEFKPEVGFEFQFWGGTETRQFLQLCKVLEVVLGKKISYSWRYEDIAGSTVVTYELFEEGSNTKVRLTHEGIETFPKDVPELVYENFVDGWNFIIGTSLKNYLEKN